MKVHQVIGDATLEVSMNLADRYLAPDVLDTEVGKVGFCDCLVDCLVFFNSSQEIAPGFVARHILVVRVTCINFEIDVCRDDVGIVAE